MSDNHGRGSSLLTRVSTGLRRLSPQFASGAALGAVIGAVILAAVTSVTTSRQIDAASDRLREQLEAAQDSLTRESVALHAANYLAVLDGQRLMLAEMSEAVDRALRHSDDVSIDLSGLADRESSVGQELLAAASRLELVAPDEIADQVEIVNDPVFEATKQIRRTEGAAPSIEISDDQALHLLFGGTTEELAEQRRERIRALADAYRVTLKGVRVERERLVSRIREFLHGTSDEPSPSGRVWD